MGDAADDLYDAMERQADRIGIARANIIRDCSQWNCAARLYRDEEGLLTCKDCGESFDE